MDDATRGRIALGELSSGGTAYVHGAVILRRSSNDSWSRDFHFLPPTHLAPPERGLCMEAIWTICKQRPAFPTRALKARELWFFISDGTSLPQTRVPRPAHTQEGYTFAPNRFPGEARSIRFLDSEPNSLAL